MISQTTELLEIAVYSLGLVWLVMLLMHGISHMLLDFFGGDD